jgi:hypothetical protein
VQEIVRKEEVEIVRIEEAVEIVRIEEAVEIVVRVVEVLVEAETTVSLNLSLPQTI